MDYDYILFDLDGTLSDSADGIINCLEETLRELKMPIPDRHELIKYIGPPLEETFTLRFGLTLEMANEAMGLFRNIYGESGLYQNEMYAGVREMLDAIKAAGKKLAVATTKREIFGKLICERYGIDGYFEIIAGNSEDASRTEKDEVIEYILECLKITDRTKVLMVGDRFYDVNGATKCGMDCMGVSYGYGGEKELLNAGAKYIAHSPQDVASQILN